ncbi:MAG TPA: hypothetical protein PKO33_09265, partial [Pyrinomonadaceae bacterium]|nr:hypothetical protein [Pyrinomonadaceae bacterium]
YSSMPVTKTVEDLEDEGILAAQPAQIAASVSDPADEPFSSVPVPATAPEPEAEPEAIDAEPVSESPPTARDRVSDLRLQLLNFGIDAEDLETQFLPDGVSSFDALTEDQAAEIVPDMEAVREAKSNAAPF